MTNETKDIIRLRFTPEVSEAAHGSWMAVCAEFKLAASGRTKGEARRMLRRIVDSFASLLRKKGILIQALEESGFSYERIPIDVDEDVVLVTIYEDEPSERVEA